MNNFMGFYSKLARTYLCLCVFLLPEMKFNFKNGTKIVKERPFKLAR